MSYLGVPPFGRTSRTVTEVVATSGQTIFYPTGGYIAGYIDVYLNGAQLSNSDFTASNGSSLVLAIPAVAGDELRFISYTLSLVTGGGGSVTVSETAPPVPTNGSKWVNSNTKYSKRINDYRKNSSISSSNNCYCYCNKSSGK